MLMGVACGTHSPPSHTHRVGHHATHLPTPWALTRKPAAGASATPSPAPTWVHAEVGSRKPSGHGQLRTFMLDPSRSSGPHPTALHLRVTRSNTGAPSTTHPSDRAKTHTWVQRFHRCTVPPNRRTRHATEDPAQHQRSTNSIRRTSPLGTAGARSSSRECWPHVWTTSAADNAAALIRSLTHACTHGGTTRVRGALEHSLHAGWRSTRRRHTGSV